VNFLSLRRLEMGYLAYIISLIWMAFQETTGLTFNQSVKMLLDQAVVVNKWMFWVIVGIYVVGLLIALGSFLLGRGGLASYAGTLGGCYLAVMIIIPIAQGFVWWISAGMANAFGPDGITNPTKFWIFLALTVLLGAG
jgi:hypothetical protein